MSFRDRGVEVVIDWKCVVGFSSFPRLSGRPSGFVYTHIDIANGNTTGHCCGWICRVRGELVVEWVDGLRKVRGRGKSRYLSGSESLARISSSQLMISCDSVSRDRSLPHLDFLSRGNDFFFLGKEMQNQYTEKLVEDLIENQKACFVRAKFKLLHPSIQCPELQKVLSTYPKHDLVLNVKHMNHKSRL